jgi:hypothetical protein
MDDNETSFTEEVWERAYDEAGAFSDLYGCDEKKRERLTVAFANTIMSGLAEGAGLPCSDAAMDVVVERLRQIAGEGFSAAHDDAHQHGKLAQAATCYAIGGSDRHWPFDKSWFKRSTYRRDLVKAAALIIAEIERLDRAKNENLF